MNKGRKRIALLPPPTKLTYSAHTRNGFLRGLRDFGAEEVPLHINIDASLGDIRNAIEQLMRANDAPDGLITASGSAAIAANAGIEAAGKHVGRELDLVSKTRHTDPEL
ncbi:LacI family transcriptional regulator, partial [Rhizobium sp. PDO1-076]